MIALKPLAALLLSLAAALLVAAPASAGSDRPRGGAAVAQLQPLPGHEERGVVHLTVRKRKLSIIGVLIAGVYDFPGEYELRLSRRSCGRFARGVERPRFAGPELSELVGDWDGDGAALIIDGTSNTVLSLRGARSLVVYAGDGDDRWRACGRVNRIKLQNVLVSS